MSGRAVGGRARICTVCTGHIASDCRPQETVGRLFISNLYTDILFNIRTSSPHRRFSNFHLQSTSTRYPVV